MWEGLREKVLETGHRGYHGVRGHNAGRAAHAEGLAEWPRALGRSHNVRVRDQGTSNSAS